MVARAGGGCARGVAGEGAKPKSDLFSVNDWVRFVKSFLGEVGRWGGGEAGRRGGGEAGRRGGGEAGRGLGRWERVAR